VGVSDISVRKITKIFRKTEIIEPRFSSFSLYLNFLPDFTGMIKVKNTKKTRKTIVLPMTFRNFAANLGTRAPSPATLAGEGARAPRQSSEITV